MVGRRRVDPPAAVVVVDPPAAAVVVVEPLEPRRTTRRGRGPTRSTWAGCTPERSTIDVRRPPSCSSTAIPTRAATSIATTSCHVFQVRLSLMWSSPRRGHRVAARPESCPTRIDARSLLDRSGGDIPKRWPGIVSSRRQESATTMRGATLVTARRWTAAVGAGERSLANRRVASEDSQASRSRSVSRVLTELTYQPPAAWETSIS